MGYFRKKPIVIEARYFDGTHYAADHLIEWMNYVGQYLPNDDLSGQLYVGTLEDGDQGEAKHVASKGDWVIKGIAGEFYPIKPDIFFASYEAVPQVNTYFVNDREYTTTEPTLSAIQIKVSAGIEGNYLLFEQIPGQEPDVRVSDGTAFDLGAGVKRFFSAPPASY